MGGHKGVSWVFPKRWAEAKDQDQNLSTPRDGEILWAHSVISHHNVAQHVNMTHGDEILRERVKVFYR